MALTCTKRWPERNSKYNNKMIPTRPKLEMAEVKHDPLEIRINEDEIMKRGLRKEDVEQTISINKIETRQRLMPSKNIESFVDLLKALLKLEILLSDSFNHSYDQWSYRFSINFEKIKVLLTLTYESSITIHLFGNPKKANYRI